MIFLPSLRDIGKARLRACELPCESGGVVVMETTLQPSVRTGREVIAPPPKQPRLEDHLREAIRERLAALAGFDDSYLNPCRESHAGEGAQSAG